MKKREKKGKRKRKRPIKEFHSNHQYVKLFRENDME